VLIVPPGPAEMTAAAAMPAATAAAPAATIAMNVGDLRFLRYPTAGAGVSRACDGPGARLVSLESDLGEFMADRMQFGISCCQRLKQ
jgi:hypothetical protein